MSHRPRPRELAILVFLAAALSVMVFHLAADRALRNGNNRGLFVPTDATLANYLELRPEWRPRVLSAAAARLSSEVVGRFVTGYRRRVQLTVASYAAAWMLLANLVLILGFGRGSLFLMWGIFAVVAFGYAPGFDGRIYPWDLPALFFFTLFIAVYRSGFPRALPALILVGALFKETTAVLCIAPLFLDAPWRERLRSAAACGVAFVGVKVAVDLVVGNPLPFFSPTLHASTRTTLRIQENLTDLLRSPMTHPLWVNAGTLVALLALPRRDRTLAMLKSVAMLFTVNLFLFGRILESRIWFEAGPLAVYALALHFGYLDQAEGRESPMGSPP